MATQDELLQQAVVAARAGNPAEARTILSELVRQYPREARGWYLLSQLVEQPERAEFCLNKVLEIDPNNAKARQRLEALSAGGAAAFMKPKAPPPPAAEASGPPVFEPSAFAPTDFAPSTLAPPASTQPAAVKLPPWLAASPDQAAPVQRIVEPSTPQPAWLASSTSYGNNTQAYEEPGGREVIPGISSTYRPPEIPGAVDTTPPPAKPVTTEKKAKKRKEKGDYFGLIWWGASILTLLCVCACIAITFGPQAVANRFLSGGGFGSPGNRQIAPADIYKVTYKVEGSGPAQVVYVNNKGQSIDKTVNLPYTNTMTMAKGTMLMLSAQSLQKRSIHCAILINGKEWVRDSFRFSAQSASCSGVLP